LFLTAFERALESAGYRARATGAAVAAAEAATS
jgi:hypothetical protein